MATNDAINNPLAGNEGTGKYVGDQSPSLTTPDIGAATATSLDIGSTVVVDSTLDDDSFATATNTSIATSESIKAYVDSQVAANGQVVQYVVATSSTDDSTTSMTLGNSSLSVSITPTDASNRIVVMAYCPFWMTSTNNITSYFGDADLYRSSGTPATITGAVRWGNSLSSATNRISFNPFTMIGTEIAPDTNAHTYVVRFAQGASGGGTAHLYGSTYGPAFILALELLV